MRVYDGKLFYVILHRYFLIFFSILDEYLYVNDFTLISSIGRRMQYRMQYGSAVCVNPVGEGSIISPVTESNLT